MKSDNFWKLGLEILNNWDSNYFQNFVEVISNTYVALFFIASFFIMLARTTLAFIVTEAKKQLFYFFIQIFTILSINKFAYL